MTRNEMRELRQIKARADKDRRAVLAMLRVPEHLRPQLRLTAEQVTQLRAMQWLPAA